MQTNAKCVSILDGSGLDNVVEYFAPDANGQYGVPNISTTQRDADNLLSLIKLCSGTGDWEQDNEVKVAILDTGIFLEHPIFKKYIRNYIDLTGEGITDFNGHGSMVTLQFLISGEEPLSYKDFGLYICKILSSDGQGTAENIIKGMKWAESQKVRIINLSAGIDNRIWHGLKSCNGTCEVCKTAYNLKNSNIYIAAAAGNNGKTVCPAKVSLYYQDSYVYSVGALDAETGTKVSWSGEGKVYMPGTVYMDGRLLLK